MKNTIARTLEKEIPNYRQMKSVMAAPRERKGKKKRKTQTLTEYSQNGSKPVLKAHVSVNQAARKLYEYEQCGLNPHEVIVMVERAENMEARLKKMEEW